MQKLTRASLWGLEQYASRRDEFRQQLMTHKLTRRLLLGPHATLLFEDSLTMKYQVQEMLRAERIFEPHDIDNEIAAYNPLIPDGRNWKATFMIEYEDAAERQRMLAQLTGVEHKVWVRVDGFDRVFAVANEDLERSTDEKTAAVHFLRFELNDAGAKALRAGATLAAGIDHPKLMYTADPVPDAIRASLLNDLD